MRIVIIIPTYNERTNIASLLDAVEHQCERLVIQDVSLDLHVLVVDDHSPDGTGDEVRRLQTRIPNLHLLEGPKAGLGAAYIRGMRHAMQYLGADVVCEMDADFSHKPDDLPRLLEPLHTGEADFVIGSRYVEGGSIPANWGWKRRLNSLGGNLVARHGAQLAQVRDCTAGFRAIRCAVLRRIDLTKLNVKGYVFQVALLAAALKVGARVREVPVDFIDRTAGVSKLQLSDVTEFMRYAVRHRASEARTAIRFATVGASGIAVNLTAFTIMLGVGFDKYMASPCAEEIAILSNFLLNDLWTFGTQPKQEGLHVRAMKFNAVSLLALCVSSLTFMMAHKSFPHLPLQMCQISGVLPAWLVNYNLNRRWTFRRQPSI